MANPSALLIRRMVHGFIFYYHNFEMTGNNLLNSNQKDTSIDAGSLLHHGSNYGGLLLVVASGVLHLVPHSPTSLVLLTRLASRVVPLPGLPWLNKFKLKREVGLNLFLNRTVCDFMGTIGVTLFTTVGTCSESELAEAIVPVHAPEAHLLQVF